MNDKNEVESGEKLIEDRKNKVFHFFKKTNIWVFVFLIIAVILGVYIRSLPMTTDGGNPGLWDITTNNWTLGPDLDPFLFLRYAKTIVENGSLPKIDTMRNVPLGFETEARLSVIPHMIAGVYKILKVFSFGIDNLNVEFAADILPVIMFALTIIFFFLFVREIFIRKDKRNSTHANLISLISTFFMIIIPALLPRTVAGIPEKESAGFLFIFLSFYLFLKAWKSEKLGFAVIFGVLAGISTAIMSLIWGGVVYIYVTIGIACFIAFILNKIEKKEFIVYTSWLISSLIISLPFIANQERTLIYLLISSLDKLLTLIVFFILAIHFVIWKTRISKLNFWGRFKIPKNITSLIIALILGLFFFLIFMGPGFIFNKIKEINQLLFNPTTGRWNITVAENRQPYFTEWADNFGPFIKNIPILFWLFFIGSVVLFKNMLKSIKKIDSFILTGLYVFFFIGLVFSRYSSSSIFNGESFISSLLYYGSALLLFGSLIYFYSKYHKNKDEGFEKIDFEYLLLFSLFALCLFTARSAVRLIMVLAPIAPIFVSFLIVFLIDNFRKKEDKTKRAIYGGIAILIILLSIFISYNFYREITAQSEIYVPSYYNQQWQKAMSWVRESTLKNAVFVHWWDYGYWVQSIGERATITDGGNAISFWNYLMGRYVLTADNQKETLDFLYNHNASYLLIDSTDIGKYTAFSSIGSDENYDRYSWISAMTSDEAQSQETKEGIIRIYQGGIPLDEDLEYNKDGKELFFPAGKAAIIGIIIEMKQNGQEITSFNQPKAVFYYQGIQYEIPLRYVYFNKQLFDFKNGLEASAYVIPRIIQTEQGGIKVDNLGALIYISPRVMRGLLAQLYLLDDSFNKFSAFELVHNEPSLIVESLRSQGSYLDDFIYFKGIQGPIKIWKINYSGREEIKAEYLDVDSSKYLNWEL